MLVAEDNVVNQTLIQKFLERSGHYVSLVDNGEAAVEMAGKGWDLIFMDVQMPQMDGLEATRRIRARHGDRLPIIALTANAMPDDRRRCAEAGMSDFVSKPFEFKQLRATMRRWAARGHDVLGQAS